MEEKNKQILTLAVILIFIMFIYISSVCNIHIPLINEIKDALIRIWIKW